MKKIFFVTLLLTVIAVGGIFFCSCGAEADVYDLLLAAEGACGEPTEKGIYCIDRTRNTENGDIYGISAQELGFLYGGKMEAPACIERISSYAVRLPLGTDGYEIHILKCVSVRDTAEAEALLLSRVERLQSAEILEYAPEGYELYFRGAEVRTVGRYAVLLATPDNAAAFKAIKRLVAKS